MGAGKLKLIYYTLIYLKFKQIYYRLFYIIRNKLFKKEYNHKVQYEITSFLWEDGIESSFFYDYKDNSFSFLNITHAFNNEIDWDISSYGKLWNYNLNYFDFLNQEEISRKTGLNLILSYIKLYKSLNFGRNAYPISLRTINIVKFNAKNNSYSNQLINNFLFNQYEELLDKLEYELLGNHLLENAFSLFFGAYYFKSEKLYTKAKKLLINQLNEQILNDGAHFERSPMYHQIILFRLLDCINLVKLNSWKEDEFISLLLDKAKLMLGWLDEVTYNNGNIPMVNDCICDFAPSSKQLFDYAIMLGVEWKKNKLNESGYRKITKKNYEFFLDVEGIKPNYQAGHAHSDTFNFEFYVNNNPIIVDTGTSSYEEDEFRSIERSTSAHNTVVVDGKSQSQMWSVFRVAKRANVKIIKDEENIIEAFHDGYEKPVGKHLRSFCFLEDRIRIVDRLTKKSSAKTESVLHFHPSVGLKNISNESIEIESGVVINFSSPNDIKIRKETYYLANGFNKRIESIRLVVNFKEVLNTQILI